MTPEDRDAIWGPREPQAARGDQRTERRAVTRPGGIIHGCGCRFTRTGGQWLHITPCRAHQLLHHPIVDERMKEIL
jgi:hypothetical protein